MKLNGLDPFRYQAPPTVDDVVRDWAADGVDSAAAVVVAIDSLSALLSTGAVSNVLCAALTKLTRSSNYPIPQTQLLGFPGLQSVFLGFTGRNTIFGAR